MRLLGLKTAASVPNKLPKEEKAATEDPRTPNKEILTEDGRSQLDQAEIDRRRVTHSTPRWLR